MNLILCMETRIIVKPSVLRLWVVQFNIIVSGAPCISGVVRIDALGFLAGCHTRRLNQALSVLCL